MRFWLGWLSFFFPLLFMSLLYPGRGLRGVYYPRSYTSSRFVRRCFTPSITVLLLCFLSSLASSSAVGGVRGFHPPPALPPPDTLKPSGLREMAGYTTSMPGFFSSVSFFSFFTHWDQGLALMVDAWKAVLCFALGNGCLGA